MMPGALRVLAALVSGVIFGLGLAISGMMNPAKVIGFLDVAGDWDPTLAFVMSGALLVTIPAFRFIPKRTRPVLDKEFSMPTTHGRKQDRPTSGPPTSPKKHALRPNLQSPEDAVTQH